MIWNLRIVYNPHTKEIGFKEVFYVKKRIWGWTKDFLPKEHLIKQHVQDALKKPILKQNKKSLKELK